MNRIIRIKTEKGFTIIPNIIFSSGLSLRAIGLLTYILHLPDDWVLYKSYLYDNMPDDGRDAIRTAWLQLEKKGFIYTKREGGGKGKLPEISYIVYDSPQKMGDNQQAETRPPETSPSGTNPLLNTNSLNTNQQSTNIPFIPDGINGAAQSQKPGKKKKKPPQQATPAPDPEPETAPKVYPGFIEIYDRWFKKLNEGIPPNYANGNGTAAKALIVYFQKIVRVKAEANGEALDDAGINALALESWQLVLDNWPKLDGFLQAKTRLVDINSNIQNIITQIKNGHSKSKQQPTGGNVSTGSLASAIAGHYAGTGQGSGTGNQTDK